MKRNVRSGLLGGVLAASVALGASAVLVAPASAAIVRTAKDHPVSYQPNLRKAAALHRRARAFASGSVVPVAPAVGRAPVAYKACSGFEAACLSYFGGPVMRTTTLTPIFWNPTGLGAVKYPTGYKEEIERFFTDLMVDSGEETNFFSVLTQYSDDAGQIQYAVTSNPGLEDKDALPGSIASEERCATPYKGTSRPCVTDLGVRKELEAYVTKEGLATGLGHEYVVFLPDGLDVCFDGGGEPGGRPDEECSGTGFCGYHATLHLSGGSGEIQYANEPENAQYAFNLEDLEKEPPEFVFEGGGIEVCTTRSGLKAGAETLSSASHEVSESVTDPEPAEGSLAWYDEHKFERGLLPAELEPEYAEIGDMCAYEYRQGEKAGGLFFGKLVAPPATNQTINGDEYLLQTEWDNAHGACTVSEAATPDASFSHLPAKVVSTGEAISFDGSGSKAPSGIVSYEWSWGDGTSASSSTPTASHSYSSAQGQAVKAFTVTLKITDKEGNTDVSTLPIEVADRQPSAVISAPASLTAGTPATFGGGASGDPDGSIVGYAWSFGDGTPVQPGVAPSHTYPAAGTYTVTLTVTDDAGEAASVSGSVTVAPAPAVVTSFGPPVVTPSNKLGFTHVKQNRDGSLDVGVIVLAPGVLSARDGRAGIFARLAAALAAKAKHKPRKHRHQAVIAFVSPLSVSVAGPGEVTLHLTLTAAGQRELAVKHSLVLSVLYTFAPTGGTPASVKQSYPEKAKAAKRKHKKRKHH
jgi:chitodextrinase